MIYDMHKRHSGEHACVSCRQIVMRISSDAGCLEDDVTLRLRLLFLELLPALMILSVLVYAMAQQQGDVVRLH